MSGSPDTEAEFGEFPWMVAINWIQSRNPYICGGSLITPNVVLSSAHNLQWKNPNQLKVIISDWDRSSTIETQAHQERRVSQIIIHEQFDTSRMFNDIALVILASPFLLAPHINTVCLPPPDFNVNSAGCQSTGWGKEAFDKQQYRNTLKRIELPVVSNEQCERNLRETRLGKNYELHPSFMCAEGERGKDMCKGDGGSPLVCPIPGETNRYYQVGIVSWGIQCGLENIPGVYVNVSYLRSWIDQQLSRKNIDESLYTP